MFVNNITTLVIVDTIYSARLYRKTFTNLWMDGLMRRRLLIPIAVLFTTISYHNTRRILFRSIQHCFIVGIYSEGTYRVYAEVYPRITYAWVSGSRIYRVTSTHVGIDQGRAPRDRSPPPTPTSPLKRHRRERRPVYTLYSILLYYIHSEIDDLR